MNRGKYNVRTGEFEGDEPAPGHRLGSLTGGANMYFRQTRDGIVFTGKKARRVRLPSNDFSLFVGKKDDDGNPRLGVTNGIVSGFDDEDANNGLPTGMTAGGDPPFLIPVDLADKVAWIAVDFDIVDEVVNGISKSIDVGATRPANTSSTIYIPLGDFSRTGKKLTIGSGRKGIGSQVVKACRNQFYAATDGLAWDFSYGPA